MIEAIGISCNQFMVVATDPLTGKQYQAAKASSAGEAERFAHFMNRRYIIETMCAWLRQRMKAYQVTGFEQQRTAAIVILGELIFLSQASVGAIRKYLREHEKQIRSIAPGEKSRQYRYYEKVIGSIMAFCQETEAVHA